MGKQGELQKIEQVIGSLKAECKLTNKDREFQALRRWPEIVGDRIAENTKPLYITENSVYVMAKGSVWCQELSYIKSKIIKEINETMGFDAIKDVRYRVEDTE